MISPVSDFLNFIFFKLSLVYYYNNCHTFRT